LDLFRVAIVAFPSRKRRNTHGRCGRLPLGRTQE
jgi:hypothetical protein